MFLIDGSIIAFAVYYYNIWAKRNVISVGVHTYICLLPANLLFFFYVHYSRNANNFYSFNTFTPVRRISKTVTSEYEITFRARLWIFENVTFLPTFYGRLVECLYCLHEYGPVVLSLKFYIELKVLTFKCEEFVEGRWTFDSKTSHETVLSVAFLETFILHNWRMWGQFLCRSFE